MATVVEVGDVQAHLFELLRRVERGEEFVIARGGTPVGRLTAVDPPGERPLGTVRVEVPDSFFAELPEGELRAWG